MSMSVKRWGYGSAAAFLVGSDGPALQYIAFTDLHADRPHEQPGCETISRGANLTRLPQGALPYRRHAPPVFEEFFLRTALSRAMFTSNFARQNSGRVAGTVV